MIENIAAANAVTLFLIPVGLNGKGSLQPFTGPHFSRINSQAERREPVAQFLEQVSRPRVFRREDCYANQKKQQTLKEWQEKPCHTQGNKHPSAKNGQPAFESSCHNFRRAGIVLIAVEA